MKYFVIDKRIDEDLLNSFSQFCNDNSNEEWTITISSAGGKPHIARVIIQMINSKGDGCTLISCSVYSAAFDIFYYSKCKKKIADRTGGMVHMASMDAKLQPERQSKIIYGEDLCISKTFKKTPGMIKKILTKKEFKYYKRGDDVFFTFKRMQRIFPEAATI